jgi:hypothetical protein
MSNPSKPVAKIGFPVTGAIFRNERNGRAYYSATFQRSYKDDDGNWKQATSFSMDELLPLAKIVDATHTEMGKLRNADREAVQVERPPSED